MPINIAKNVKGKEPGAWLVPMYKGLFLVLLRDDDTWDCPGGHVEEGESNKTAAIRELYEETGLIAPKKDVIKINEGVNDGYAHAMFAFEMTKAQLDTINIDSIEHSSHVFVRDLEDIPGELFAATASQKQKGWFRSLGELSIGL